MSVKEVVIIDYGLNNLLSVQRALEYCGARVIVTKDHVVILKASYVVLPGVGAFGSAMKALNELGLLEVIRGVAERGVPLLGICLGMQLLLTESEEFGLTQGLDLIAGRVIGIPKQSFSGNVQKVPHVGWNELVLATTSQWEGTMLERVKQGLSVYFLHSFMAQLKRESNILAVCEYGDRPITAAILQNNIMGCQFHPEKSGEVGLAILKSFLTL